MSGYHPWTTRARPARNGLPESVSVLTGCLGVTFGDGARCTAAAPRQRSCERPRDVIASLYADLDGRGGLRVYVRVAERCALGTVEYDDIKGSLCKRGDGKDLSVNVWVW